MKKSARSVRFPAGFISFLILIGSSWIAPLAAESANATFSDWSVAGDRPLGRYLHILRDSENFDSERVLSGALDGRFELSSRDSPTFGFRSETFWVLLRIANQGSERIDRLVQFGNPSMDEVRVFVLDRNRKLIKRLTIGDDRPFREGRDFQYRIPNFRIDLEAGEARFVYLRVRTTGSMNLFLNVWHQANLNDSRLGEYMVRSLFYGILVAMILYNFFLYLAVRGRFGFLHYVSFIVAFLGAQLATNGLGFQYLWPDIPVINQFSVPAGIYLSAFTFLSFSRNFLVFSETSPLWDRIARILSAAVPVIFIVTFGAYLIFDWRRYVLPANLFSLIVVVFAIAGGILAHRAGLRQARFFLVAWGGLILGILIVLLRNLGLTPSWALVDWGLELGSTWMVLMLSLGLADVINSLRRELEQYSRTLEQRVEERTRNLKESLDRIRELKEQQDGDYYLTSLLMEPLGFVRQTGTGSIRVDTILQQYKKFNFRNRQSQIGGDFLASDEIVLRDKEYLVFMNADAMGKSMQGAGGYLVLGSVFASIVERTRRVTFERDIYPERWLKNNFQDINRIFEAFDGSMMVSATLGLIERRTGATYILNAEHPLPVLYRDGRADFVECDDYLRRFGSTLANQRLRIAHFRLQPGDVLILGSDGRDDLRLPLPGNPINEDERLFLQHVERGRGQLNSIHDQVLGTGELSDDFSLMRLEFVGDPDWQPEDPEQVRAARRHVAGLYESGRYAEAARLGLEYAQAYPEQESFIYAASLALRREGRYNEAADEGERLILRDPRNPRYLANLVKIYTVLDPELARQYRREYKAAKDRFPGS